MNSKVQVIELLQDYLGYEQKIKLPTLVYKKFREIKDDYGYGLLLSVLKKYEDDIRCGIEYGSFRDDTAKVRYIFTIVENHMPEIYQEKKAEQLAIKRMDQVEFIDEEMPPYKKKGN